MNFIVTMIESIELIKNKKIGELKISST